MTKKIAIVTDSTSDLKSTELKNLEIESLPLKVIYDNKQFHDRVDIQPQEVYEKLDEEIPTTSMPSPKEIKETYLNLKDKGYTHIISIHISSGLSATYNNCKMVAEQMDGINIEVIDSKMLSKGLGRLVLYAKELVDAGQYDFEKIIDKIEAKKEKIEVFFVVKTLKYLKEGGRIGKVAGTIAQLLNIKPIISIDDDGEYFTFDKVRGRNRSLKKIFSIVKDRLKEDKNYLLDVVNAAAEEEAKKLKNKFEDLDSIKEIFFGEISPVMIVHTGPGLIGVVVTEMDD